MNEAGWCLRLYPTQFKMFAKLFLGSALPLCWQCWVCAWVKKINATSTEARMAQVAVHLYALPSTALQ